jgi:hypothetical protein
MSSDSFDRTIHHRNEAVADTPLITLVEWTRLTALKLAPDQGGPATPFQDDRPGGLISVMGARDVEFAFYANASDNGTFDATIVGVPAIIQRIPGSRATPGPRLLRLAKFNCIVGASAEATTFNPISGAAEATITFLAIDTLAVAIEGTGIQLWDAGGNGGLARAAIDPAQCPKIFCYVDNFTNVTSVDVQVRRISRFGITG